MRLTKYPYVQEPCWRLPDTPALPRAFHAGYDVFLTVEGYDHL